MPLWEPSGLSPAVEAYHEFVACVENTPGDDPSQLLQAYANILKRTIADKNVQVNLSSGALLQALRGKGWDSSVHLLPGLYSRRVVTMCPRSLHTARGQKFWNFRDPPFPP